MIKYCINTKMINDKFNLLEKIKFASKTGFSGVEPWYYEINNSKDIVNCCADYNINIPSLEVLTGVLERDCGLLNITDSDNIFDECKRRFEIADKINATHIVVTPPFSHRGFEITWDMCLERFNELYEYCTLNFKCKITLEFMGQTKLINNYDTCKKFLKQANNNVKMVIDAYHIWRGGFEMDCFREFELNDVSLFHISDADKSIERTAHRDRDRVLLIDGQIDLQLFANTIKQTKYKNFISVGVYNPRIAEDNPLFVLEKTKKSLDILFK